MAFPISTWHTILNVKNRNKYILFHFNPIVEYPGPDGYIVGLCAKFE